MKKLLMQKNLPYPTVDFSKDGSSSQFGGWKKCQINLYDTNESYNLVAKVINYEGYFTYALTLNWRCSDGMQD